jgi:hypothetical protein
MILAILAFRRPYKTRDFANAGRSHTVEVAGSNPAPPIGLTTTVARFSVFVLSLTHWRRRTGHEIGPPIPPSPSACAPLALSTPDTRAIRYRNRLKLTGRMPDWSSRRTLASANPHQKPLARRERHAKLLTADSLGETLRWRTGSNQSLPAG